MCAPEERASLLARCEEFASRGEWSLIGDICDQVTSAAGVPAVERADWMRKWAIWIWQESQINGRHPGLVRGLLAEAVPLAKIDHQLLAKILVTQTRVLVGADVEKAARQFWALLGKHPELAVYRGHVFYNLALNCSFVGALEKAARYYRQAAVLLKGQEQGWAYFNLAEVCAHLGRSRAAGAAAEHCQPLLQPEDRHMYASLMAYLAVVRGDNTRALSLIEAALDDPDCPPLSRSHLWYYQALVFNQLGAVAEAEEVVERTWRYAAERHHLWICDRLAKLRAEMDARKGVS